MRGRLHPGSGKLSVESLEFREMTMEDIFLHTFKAMNSELGISQHADNQPLWQRRLSTASVFCQALVANNYLTTEQMQRAAQRYRLGASRDGGVIFWQIDEPGQLRDGKIMHYHPDCHRDHDRRPTWISYLLRKYGKLPEEWKSEHCLFGLHLLGHTEITENTEIITHY
jgi:hypothetical protein